MFNPMYFREKMSFFKRPSRIFWVWVISTFLAFSAVSPNLFFLARFREKTNLDRLKSVIEFYILRHTKLPESFLDIERYAEEIKVSIQTHDAFKLPYEYAEFGDNIWYLKSPETDQFRTSHSWKDEFKSVPPTYGGPMGAWPQASLTSALSYDQKYIARLLIAQSSPFKRLVITKNDAERTPVWSDMIHDVDEFVWLENGLFYSASEADGRDRSGAYYFSLRNLTSEKLFAITQEKSSEFYLDPTHLDGKNFNLAILASDNRRVELAIGESTGQPISLEDFFSARKAFQIEEKAGDIIVTPTELFYDPRPFEAPAESENTLANSFNSLPTTGDITEVIEVWQEGANLFENTPLFAQILWGLANLYRNASLIMLGKNEVTKAKKLGAIAAEYSLSLSQRTDTPKWMKNCSLWLWQEHQKGHKPIYTKEIELH